MASVWQLLDDLAGSLLFGDHQSMAVTPSIAIGEKPPNRQQLLRKARITSYETLLSHRHDGNSFGRIFDQLYVKCCELKLRRDISSLASANSLIGLVDTLKHSEPSVDTVNVLKLLLALAGTGALEDRQPRTGLGKAKDFRNTTPCSEGGHIYEQFPSGIFQNVDSVLLQKGFYDHFDPKLFEQCPGFASATSKLSCQRFSSPLSETVAPTLYGALSLPLKDSWQLDVRMDFPELLEESPAPRLQLKPYREPALSTMQRSVPMLAVEEDEGFVETTETPSSACSFCRTADFGDVFSSVLEKDGPGVGVTKPRYMTWESHGSYVVPREKPLLSEAGEHAVDEVILCLHHDLSLVNPDFHPVRSISIPVTDLFHDAISVMIGIPSSSFKYDQESGSFLLAPVTVSGLSADAVKGLLKHFTESGRAYLSLDAACRSAKLASESLVQKALFEAVGCYLRHYQQFVQDLPKNVEGGLLHLSVTTSKFCGQICLILRLLAMNGDSFGSEEIFWQLPRGVCLLRQLYDAFESIPSGSAVDDRVVLLSFFVAACQPYIRYVRSWAFEGRLQDPYDEFPVAKETDFLLQRDEQFWRKSLRLVEDAADPLLGSFSTAVFVCGKSLHLLRLCCPQHHLFTSTVAAPSLEIAFSEARQKELVSISERYYVAVKAEVDRSTLSRELKRLLHEKDKEELFRQAHMASRLSQMQRQREDERRREACLAKKRHLMADLKAQMEEKKADLLHAEAAALRDDALSETTFISTLREVTTTLSKLSMQDTLAESTGSIVNTAFLDANMNPTGTENIDAELDPNANEDVTSSVDEITSRQDPISIVVATAGEDEEEEDALKGVKRKQDRDSIDFDSGGLARRFPCSVLQPPSEWPMQPAVPSTGVRKSETRHGGVLIEGSTFVELRSRGRSAHGHSSDSTIQKLMYGDSARNHIGGALLSVGHLAKSSEDLKHGSDLQAGVPVSICTNLRLEPYTAEFGQLNQLPMADIFKPLDVMSKTSDVDVSPDVLFRLPLSVVLQKCLTAPLRAQVSCVDSCLLEYFLVTLGAEEQLMALRNYFFMQDGEFGQTLSDLLFERLSVTTYPSELLNPVVLNPILAGALAFSSTENHFLENVGFVVKYMPESFHPNSPSALNCLQLSYRVDWPMNILLSSDDIDHYQRIFSFVLQMRRCMWSLGNVFSLLKDVDTRYDLASSPQYRSLQFFRHEMLHFIRSLYEYIGVQAFQTTWFRLRQQIGIVRNLEGLITAHSKYLRQISFRCLLHKKAVPVMKIVQDLFAIILKFRSQLLSSSWRHNENTDSMEIECFPQLCSSFASFRDHSTFLYKVISKLARRGYQTHLMEFSLSLDFNGYYSNQAAQLRDVSIPSLSMSASDNQSI